MFLSGNGTTSVSGEDAVRLGRARQIYFDNVPYSAPPKQGPIVKRSERGWRDYEGRDWSAAVPFDLPDYDLFVVDAAAEQPRVVQSISKVGTVLFNIAVQPGSGEIWVSNTEALNHIPHESRLSGLFAQNRVTRVTRDGASYRTVAIHLNPHVEFAAPSARAMRDLSLAQPLDLVFQPDGREAYVAAFGSGKIGVLDAQGDVIDRIAVGFGPGGLALDARHGRLYVLNHLEATISVVDVRQRRTVAQTALRHDPTPAVVKRGRPFFPALRERAAVSSEYFAEAAIFRHAPDPIGQIGRGKIDGELFAQKLEIAYDAKLTSRFGDLSCAICHVFGDIDGLARDLGDPVGSSMDYPARLRNTGLAEPRQALHPLMASTAPSSTVSTK